MHERLRQPRHYFSKSPSSKREKIVVAQFLWIPSRPGPRGGFDDEALREKVSERPSLDSGDLVAIHYHEP